jgi:hypothetical protein
MRHNTLQPLNDIHIVNTGLKRDTSLYCWCAWGAITKRSTLELQKKLGRRIIVRRMRHRLQMPQQKEVIT